MTIHVSSVEGQALLKKPHKYRAIRTILNGVTFDSKREARRWAELVIMQRAGAITELERQVSYPLYVPVLSVDGDVVGLAVTGRYVADFRYVERGVRIVEDCKGYRTRGYRAKRKHLLLQHGIVIYET